MNQLIMLLVLFAALFALAYAALNFVLVRKLKEGNERMQEIAAAIREAQKAKEEGTPRTILFNLSGTGVIDLYAYEQYLAGVLKDYTPSDAEIAKTVNRLEKLI